jgi:hypothetical protein
MKDRALIATGAVGVVLAAICCAAPLLAVTLATAGTAIPIKSLDKLSLAKRLKEIDHMKGAAVGGKAGA